MKKLLLSVAVIGLLQSGYINAQFTVEQSKQISVMNANEQIQDLIMRSMSEWSSAGYTVMTYQSFKNQSPLSSDIMRRFEQSYSRYVNKTYGNENNSFVIYKRTNTGVQYLLQVIEDCPSNYVPNKFTQADSYIQ